MRTKRPVSGKPSPTGPSPAKRRRVVAAALCAIGSACAPAAEPPASATAGAYPAVPPTFLSGLEWRFVGPVRGGRAPAVAGDPDDPLVFYFGTGHGGVWKTTDAGVTWSNVSDGWLDVAPVGAIAVAPSNPRVVWVGTGEGIPRQHVTGGDGVYRSTDGGESWTHVGLEATRHIAALVVHPRDPDVAYVAAKGDLFGPSTDRGVYRTRDGGRTWQRVLYQNDLAGAVDLSIDPAHPNVLYAALDHHVRYPWDEISGGPGSGLYKTTDGGDSWSDLTHNPGFPAGPVGKIGVAVSPARPSRVYAIVEAADGGVYRSDDAGATWRKASVDRAYRLFPASYSHIRADTRDPDVVYVQHIALWKSTDGGLTFSTVPMRHSDHHAMWIDPRDARRIIDGSDGGASVTLDGGRSWSTLDNQPTADLFSLAVDHRDPYWIYTAQNDNSHVAFPSRSEGTSITLEDYLAIPQGEGGQTAVKPDGSVVYAGDRTSIVRFDRAGGQGRDISVWPEDEFGKAIKDVQERFYYSFPVYLSPHDPGVLYTGSQYLYRTQDEGQTWERVSPDLSRDRKDVMGNIPGRPITSIASSLYYVSLIRSIEESPLDANELWVGTDDSTVQLTRDGGRTWQDVSPPDLPEWTTITAVAASAHHPGTAYVSGERHRMSDRAPYLLKTTDYGRTWQRITGGLRDDDFTYVIREDPVRAGLLYAGTETGVRVSFDDGASWQPLQRNLPVAAAMSMLVVGNDLVVATHGRGVWILDDVDPLRRLTPEVVAEPAHLFAPVPTTRNLAWRPGPSRPVPGAGTNPPTGVLVDYHLAAAPTGEATLTILDATGTEIRSFSSTTSGRGGIPARAGMNRFLWDMRYPDVPEAPRDGALTSLEATSPAAPVVPPGRYRVRLSVDGDSLEQPFEIRRDPDVAATDADLQAQFRLMMEIRRRASEVVDALGRIHDARDRLAASGDATLAPRLREIEGRLQRLTNPDNPMDAGPKGLYNQLGSLSRTVLSAEAPPTRSELAVFDTLSVRIDVQLRALDELLGAREASPGGS